jgi:Putative transposase, YhgA-like
MPRHDSIFKQLLRSFFADLLRLVVPELAARLDLERTVHLDKEFFTPAGIRRELDVLVEVPFQKLGVPALLVHVEVEARARPGMGWRLWRYRRQIQAVHERHVLPIVLYLQRGRPGVEVRVLDEDLLGADLADFRYVALGLAGADGEAYLARPEPLAWALAALMAPGTRSRPAYKLACLSRIAAADLEESKRMLLVNCVETYLELNLEERAEYSALCTVPENREVRAMAMTWAEKLEAKGLEKGMQRGMLQGIRALRRVLLSLLEQRFGALPEETRQRVEAISSVERLTRLNQRALTARSLASLRL